jgi:hypothetical protein
MARGPSLEASGGRRSGKTASGHRSSSIVWFCQGQGEETGRELLSGTSGKKIEIEEPQ